MTGSRGFREVANGSAGSYGPGPEKSKSKSKSKATDKACPERSRRECPSHTGSQPWQPAVDRAAVGVIGRSKGGAEMRLFVENDEEMSKQEPGQCEEHDRQRVLVEAVAKEHKPTTDVHR